MKKKLALNFSIIAVFFLSYIFIGGDCGTNNKTEIPNTVAAPGSVSFSVNANPGGGESFAEISWTSSPDETDNDFRGYRVITYTLTSSNVVDFILDNRALPDSAGSYVVPSLERNARYKSAVLAELKDGTQSSPVETIVYGGVYYNGNGSIDSHVNDNSLSGYGWNVQSGNGNQYLYINSNSNLIDLHLREDTGELFFNSPDIHKDNFRSSKIDLIGLGESAFDETDLDEPDKTIIKVEDENVYLLKTQDGYYIKIWVKNIDRVQNQYYNVTFVYKFQPIQGLRVL